MIGCGNIAPQYIQGCAPFPQIEVVSCADIDEQRARQFAADHQLRAQTIDAMLADETIDLVINLTIPAAHADVALDIINASKHVYNEKPLGMSRIEAEQVLSGATAVGVRVGCAPDTFLGAGIQSARKLIDEGVIGRPFTAQAFFASHGPESWHPNPFFFYQPGAGPLWDMGPYYITALVALLGGVKSVFATNTRAMDVRIAGHESIQGERIPVNVDTHYTAILQFASGVSAVFIASFDIWHHRLPHIEVQGDAGSISLPDPNTFSGEPMLATAIRPEPVQVSPSHRGDMMRGIGVADMADAILNDRPHRASGALALHVVEVMEAFTQSSTDQQVVKITNQIETPAPLPPNLGLELAQIPL